MKSPKLICQITGQSRITSENYLRQKAERLGKSVDWLLNNYVSKQICSQLRKGKNISELTDKVFSDEQLTKLVANNSKSREAFTFNNGSYVAQSKTKRVNVVKETKEQAPELSKETTDIIADLNKQIVKEVPKTSDEVLEEMINNRNPF